MRDRGSITVEAAICLPFFIIAVISFVFLIKVYFAHEIIHNAITGACDEMSVYSIIYYSTNAEELVGGLEKFCNSEKVSNALENTGLLQYIREFGKDATDYVRAQAVLVPITKILVREHLGNSSDKADLRLKNLNIPDGLEGIDFTHSRMLADGRSIDVVAEYKLELPFLSQVLPDIKITQTASACIWAGEDGVNSLKGDSEDNEQCVWNLENIKRGREIRRLQGANLPFNFPVVSKYENGTAASIKSLNLDEIYYHNTINLQNKLKGYITKLQEFNGGKSGSVTIDGSQIYRKELILVVPETDITSAQLQTLNKCIDIAREKGISLKIVKAYGKQNNTKNGVDNGKDN
ncbi:pilus biosynthesis protein TadE [Ruminiclostridium papyrosolvens]|uniref:Pilus biosynthesis protein TadE n=1 Tax=Ruminiclostridium papyrosolvens C7 TaxID=1330534 RepID=U4QXD2_9FIRM|nr:pilus biosynthesis protein TadE [Ruminiclostridium papyrosolvens]EPR08279.1 pilus biosynthesis protein TadE [Ruminiclostridium papyrosolvens C7]